jgi:hypothetical protein
VPGPPIGQLLVRRRVRQDGIDVILIDQAEYSRRIVRDADDGHGRIAAQQLFETAA